VRAGAAHIRLGRAVRFRRSRSRRGSSLVSVGHPTVAGGDQALGAAARQLSLIERPTRAGRYVDEVVTEDQPSKPAPAEPVSAGLPEQRRVREGKRWYGQWYLRGGS